MKLGSEISTFSSLDDLFYNFGLIYNVNIKECRLFMTSNTFLSNIKFLIFYTDDYVLEYKNFTIYN